MKLEQVEARVLGSLIEKQLTTPGQYPLSLAGLVASCNQTTNRHPPSHYQHSEVAAALETLKAKGLVRFILPSHGRSVTRYRHVADERLGLDKPALALVGLLLLRGPQTPGELRSRGERMHSWESLAEVEGDLARLARQVPPLVEALARQPGQKELRWATTLLKEPPLPPAPTDGDPFDGAASPARSGGDAFVQSDSDSGCLEVISERVARLEQAVDALALDLGALRGELGL